MMLRPTLSEVASGASALQLRGASQIDGAGGGRDRGLGGVGLGGCERALGGCVVVALADEAGRRELVRS